ncbi:prepilin peptidase [Nocardia panacis]|uniref:Prepilin peptidase n=1 Tax=Nocardia panacis TaxID=2340916 RepID=A0A3A4KHE3_9NOCA|nr:A24 family peptidase [Nocardia panacis]RJO68355.1 prepilin peptidase [Nocardia panacis]
MSSVAVSVLALWCAALSAFDLRSRRLPNALTGAGAIGILGYALGIGRFGAALLGAALLALPYLLIHLCTPRGFGAGDVKLAVGLGAVAALAGPRTWAVAAIAAPVLTAVIGAAALGLRRIRGGDAPGPLPHAPAMCLSTALAIALVP